MMSPFYCFAYLIVNFFLLITGWKVVGKENIPQDQGYIVIANHVNLTDPALIGCAFPQQVHFLYKSEFDESPFANALFKLCGAISLRRSAADMSALKESTHNLKRGHAVGIFPEGMRNKTEQLLLPFEEGAVFMAYRNNVKIVPTAIINSHNTGKFWKRDVLVLIGEPFEVIVDKRHLREDLDRYNQLCYEKVLSLLKKGHGLEHK
jgi:1-acyl-sn-glycerol-3-phosphate acyltransferase